MKKIENIYYTAMKHPRHVLDLYLPDTDTFPVFVYFHGGGIVGGDKQYDFFNELVEKGIAVVSAHYRLYPEAAFPDFIKDAAAAVGWAHRELPQYGTVTGMYIGGSSAGGYLTQMLCLDHKYLTMQGIDPDSISGYIMDAGQPTVHFNVLKERGLDTRRVLIDEAAPIYHVTDTRNYPPMYIIVAEHDMENRYEQNVLLVSTLKHFGHVDNVTFQVMENCGHCGYVRAYNEDGKSVFANMIYTFMKQYTKGIE